MSTQWDKAAALGGTDRWSEEPSLRTDNWWNLRVRGVGGGYLSRQKEQRAERWKEGFVNSGVSLWLGK